MISEKNVDSLGVVSIALKPQHQQLYKTLIAQRVFDKFNLDFFLVHF